MEKFRYKLENITAELLYYASYVPREAWAAIITATIILTVVFMFWSEIPKEIVDAPDDVHTLYCTNGWGKIYCPANHPAIFTCTIEGNHFRFSVVDWVYGKNTLYLVTKRQPYGITDNMVSVSPAQQCSKEN